MYYTGHSGNNQYIYPTNAGFPRVLSERKVKTESGGAANFAAPPHFLPPDCEHPRRWNYTTALNLLRHRFL